MTDLINKMEAKMMMICQSPRTTTQVWRIMEKYGQKTTYNYINQKLSMLYRLGYLVKRRMGKMVYYRTSPSGVTVMRAYLESRQNEKEEDEKASSMMDVRTLSDFV